MKSTLINPAVHKVLMLVLVFGVCAITGQADDISALQGRFNKLSQTGNYKEALPLAQNIVALTKARAKQNPTHYANALNQLGIACRDLGRYSEALDCCKEALAIYRKT